MSDGSDFSTQATDEQRRHPGAVRGMRDLAMAVLMAVCALVLATASLTPIQVTADGRTLSAPVGVRVSDLVKMGALPAAPGDLLSVRGAVLRRGGGEPPVYFANGSSVATSAPLSNGSTVTSGRGADTVEATKALVAEVPSRVVFRGRGPVESIEDSGTRGYARTIVGAVSGDEVSRTVISHGRPMVVRREPAYAGAKRVALTFDDGPWPGSTDAILGELRAAGAKATFFLVGRQVAERASIVQREAAAGMEIGNHSWSHRYLVSSASKAIVDEQIDRGQAAIERVTGRRPVWYRPAGGITNRFVFDEVSRQHLRIALWTVDPRDWSRPGVAAIERRVLDGVKPGAVILMHDGGGNRSQTVQALHKVLAGLKARGYQTVTLSELYATPAK